MNYQVLHLRQMVHRHVCMYSASNLFSLHWHEYVSYSKSLHIFKVFCLAEIIWC